MANTAPVTDEEFRRLCEFLYRRTGMQFTDQKRYYVERRIADRMAVTRATSFAAYFARLRSNGDGEIEQFINAFTVNETYFYREDHQLRCLTSDLLRERTVEHGRRRDIRLWSMPCSTGEEAYSIGIWLMENWPPVDDYEIEIIGSDIDTRVLDEAREGVYGKRALMRLSPELIGRYFVDLGSERWRILDDLRQSVSFTPVNLIDADQVRSQGRFDIIFCRNVLIYFDETSRRIAAENLYESLLPGGYICLGHSESMSRISSLFEVRRYADAIVYQKPMEVKVG